MVARNARTTVVGVFEDRSAADRALEELRRAGFTDEQIGYAVRNGETPTTGEALDVSPPAEGAATGVVTGGVLGGLLGAAAVGLIPGIGPVLAAGALASILGGAAIGATAGGLLGALAGLGIPEDDARFYQREFEGGRTILTVQANDEYNQAQNIMRTAGAKHVQVRDVAATPSFDPDREADLVDDSVPTTATTPNSAPARDADYATTTMATAAEIPSSRGGDRTWDEAESEIHADWKRRYEGNADRRWSDDEAAYRFAFEMSQEPRFRNRSFEEAEPELRGYYDEWAFERGYRRDEDDPWASVRDRVRESWQHVGPTRTVL